jgi:sterol desaturase/sphingolipid hydroxylase (fatty acid hydroxylase superfamily)
MPSAHDFGIFIDLQQLQLGLLLGGLLVFVLLETFVPDARARFPARLRGGGRNLAVFALGTLATSVVLGTFYFYCAAFLAVNRVGLLYIVPVPAWLGLVLGFLAIDFSDYLFHRISHDRKWLWVMHAVHHSDPHLDVTTHFRAHPVHMLITVGWRVLVIAATGVPFWLALLHDALVIPFAEWQHANVPVAARLDRWLQAVIVTPGMHRIHHSPLPEETDSNFGGLLSVWDRLLGTYRGAKLPSETRYGLRQLAARRFQNLWGLLLTPVRAWSLAGRL